jgi:four helix bundle protein
MGVKHFTELRAWQLANRLKIEIYGFTGVAPTVHDFRFCDDIKSSIASVCSNTSEGFGRYRHKEFAHFVVIARGSLAEAQNHLIDARDRKYVDDAKFTELWNLSLDAMASLTGLLTYLQRSLSPAECADTRPTRAGKRRNPG